MVFIIYINTRKFLDLNFFISPLTYLGFNLPAKAVIITNDGTHRFFYKNLNKTTNLFLKLMVLISLIHIKLKNQI